MKSLKESVVIAMDGSDERLFQFLPFIMQDLWEFGSSPESVKWPQDRRYVTRDSSLQIARKVHSSLGKKDDVKEWLAVCLLKTVKSNQRWHKTTELIDNYPQATSWLDGLD